MAAGYIYENSAKERKGNTRARARLASSASLIIPGLSRKFRDGVPGRGRAAFEKEGRPVQSVCFSIDALYVAVWRWTYRYTGAVARGRGLRIDKNASQAGAS